MSAVVLLTAVPPKKAKGLARLLVERRLAACVSVTAPMCSIYRWKDRVETAVEAQLVIKTTRTKAAAAVRTILKEHPYELPEILNFSVGGSKKYLSWLDDSLR